MTCLCIEHDSYENVIGHAQGMPLWCAFEYGEAAAEKTFLRFFKNLCPLQKKPFCDKKIAERFFGFKRLCRGLKGDR